MEFTIAEKPLDALKNDLTLYHRLSLKLRTSCASDVVLHSRLEQLFEAELSDILSLLYYGWKHDCMESMLDRRLSGSSKLVRADFGSTEKPVIIGEDGTGEFSVGEQSVSVWVRKGAREDLTINE